MNMTIYKLIENKYGIRIRIESYPLVDIFEKDLFFLILDGIKKNKSRFY